MAIAEQQPAELLRSALCGRSLTRVEPWEFGWTFGFDADDTTITSQSLWRVMTDRIVLSSGDHLQRFGLPEPIDAGQYAASVLLGQVIDVALMPATSDLRIVFPSNVILELLNTSAGYEGWHLAWRSGKRKTIELIALGGGDLVIVPG